MLRVCLLGGFTVSVGDRDVDTTAWRLRHAKDVVKALALSPGARLQRDQVLDRLWPDKDPQAAAHSLHQALYAARRAITSAGGDGRAALQLAAETLVLCPDSDVWIDTEVFARTAREALDTGDPDRCRDALDLYQGTLLPDDRYVDWIQPHRDQLAQLHDDVVRELARHLEAAGNFAAAADLLRALIAKAPLDEPTHRQLMRVYALAGNRRAAIEQFDRLGETLQEELGVSPDVSTTALADDIIDGRLAPAREPSAPRPWARPTTNLTIPISSFVGRERELDELPGLLATRRLVTLVGAGGCGKTRLAIEVGRRCLDTYTAGVYLVELAAVRTPAEVARETARTLGVREGPEETVAEAVARRVGDDDLLLVLDNCEHLANAAVELASTLLGTCPRLTILATSREPLRVPGEVVRRVSSLDVPDPADLPPPDDLVTYDAVRLFTERVQAAQPDFRVDGQTATDVADVCFRLDGMPLALELAATRVPALSLSGLAQHLDDRFRLLTTGPRTALTRQQTLEATVDWSYDLLAPREQALFRRLSTLHGPFDLPAAETLGEPIVGRRDVAPLLGELVERSMVVADDAENHHRYRLLETMRAYGHAKLRQQGELSAARTDHARWILDLAAPDTTGEVLVDRPRRLASVHDNLRPALDHLLATNPRRAVRLAGMLWPYWLWHAHLGEGLGLLERVLASAAEPCPERFEALVGAAAVGLRWRGAEAMAHHAERALADARTLGDGHAICRALLLCAHDPWCRGDTTTATEHMAQARHIARERGHVGAEIAAIMALATAAATRHHVDEARALVADADALAARLSADEQVLWQYTLGSWMPTPRRGVLRLMWSETWVVFDHLVGPTVQAHVHAARANLERLAGCIDEAHGWLDRALSLFRSTGDVYGEALVRCRMGQVAFTEGNLDAATRHLEASLLLDEEIGHVRGVEVNLISLARVAGERGDTAAAHRYLDRVEILSRQHLDRIAMTMAMIERGILAMDEGRAHWATECLSEALTNRAAWVPHHAACVSRDLGIAQIAAGMVEEARATLSRAEGLLRRHGAEREADECRRLREQPEGMPQYATVDDD